MGDSVASGTVTAHLEAALDAAFTTLDIRRDPQAQDELVGVVQAIGRAVFIITGCTAGMMEVLDRVADRPGADHGRRTSVMDRAWHGIGAGGDIWLA